MSILAVSPSLLLIIVAMGFGALWAGACALEVHARFEHHARRAELRKRMRGFDGADSLANTDVGTMPGPARSLLTLVRFSYEKPCARIVDSVIAVCIEEGRALSPGPSLLARSLRGETGRISIWLEQADLATSLSLKDVERACVVTALVGAAFGFLFPLLLVSLSAGIVGLIAGMCLGAMFPRHVISRAARERVDRCVTQLPHMIEVISLGSTAGSSFVSSLDLYCARFEGPLPHEIGQVVAAWKTGAQSWEQALAELARRLDAMPVTHFVSTVTQAIKLGAPMAQMLEAQSAEARRSKRAQIEEKIEKAPVKMLLPMGTLILPAMLILILGPVILGMSAGG